MVLRDHAPIILEEFNGMWRRGDEDSCPIDHFFDSDNVKFFESGFETRDGINTYVAKANVRRMYNYKMSTGESIILLDSNGDFYHALIDGSETVHGPILSIPTATDFGFVAINGYAYISPYRTFTDNLGVEYQKGITGEFLYVYKGDGTAARKAAGVAPTNASDKPFIAYNSPVDGKVEKYVHLIAVAFTDGGGGRSAALGPEKLPTVIAPGGKEIEVNNIPIGGAGITGREIYATKAIDPKDYNPSASPTFYRALIIADNTTVNSRLSFTDIDLTVAFAAGALANPSDGGALRVENTVTDGFCDMGFHLIGVVYETDTGYLTAPGPEFFGAMSFVNLKKAVTISGIPTGGSAVTKRHLVSTKAIRDYNGDQTGYQFFFIPDGNIDDNTTVTKTLSYYDAELLDDASHLIDNFAEIPAGVTLAIYHSRLVLTTTFDNINYVYLSAPGEPEAIDQVDGLITAPENGLAVTNAFEFRDVFYIGQKTKTYASSDNRDEPSTWSIIDLDLGIGPSIHGVAFILDSTGVNVDSVLIVAFGGVYIFNGIYMKPELTYKIEDYWEALDQNDFKTIQIMNDTLNKHIYINLPNKKMLFANYDNGFDPKRIKWTPWSFDIEPTTIAIVETDKLIIGALQAI